MDLLEKAWWNKTWTSILVRLGIRRVPGATSGLGDILYGLSITGGETTADMTLYVDQATGSDSNSGLVGFPMKTIQAAIDRVPKIVKHNVTINVGPGTYAEDVAICSAWFGGKQLTLQGAWTTVTPSTGPATGTFTSNDGVHTFTLAGATWTVDDLKGKYIKFTSGAKNGQYFPIANNTATTVVVGCLASAVGNASFEFGVPAASIKSLSIGGERTNSGVVANINAFNLGTNVGYIGIDTTVGKLYCTNCSFISAASGSGIYSTGAIVRATRSYFNVDCGIACFSNPTYSGVYDSVFEATGVGTSGGYAINVNKGDFSLGAGGVIIQNFKSPSGGSGTGILIGNNGTFYTGATLTLRDNRIGITCYTGDTKIQGWSAAGKINISSTSDGIYVTAISKLHLAALTPSVLTITGCGRDAIRLESSGNTVAISSTSSITGNTGFGINLATGNAVAHNNIQIGSSVTMNTNTAGDLTLDGTTPISIADLRAAPSKTIVDGNRLNRLAAD